MTVAAILFEGGPAPAGSLGLTLARLRQAVCLDTVERLLALGELNQVIVATDRPELAAAASRLGARVHWTREPFDFHRELLAAVAEAGTEAVICLGGASLPLLGPEEWRWILRTLQEKAPCVVVNNPQSPDLVAWSPAQALDRVRALDRDNALGHALRFEAGLERYLLPNSGAAHFDLDTPVDYLILAESGRAGPRAREALSALDWDRSRVRAIRALLRRDLAELGLVGRVGTAVVEYLNTWFRLRVRVFSEERGMKALGREDRGEVVSFMAAVMEDLGPERFFRHLSRVCHGLCVDSRVIFAHGGRRVSDWDRYHSDLGQVEAIRDPWVRRFTAAALAAEVPVLLGGHSVVAGGLWVLAEAALADLGGPRVRYR